MASTPGRYSAHAALQFRDFRLFQGARLTSVISSQMLAVGHAVDRFDRRRVLQLVQFSYAIVAGLLLLVTLRRPDSVSLIYAILVLQGTVRAFGAPAGRA